MAKVKVNVFVLANPGNEWGLKGTPLSKGNHRCDFMGCNKKAKYSSIATWNPTGENWLFYHCQTHYDTLYYATHGDQQLTFYHTLKANDSSNKQN